MQQAGHDQIEGARDAADTQVPAAVMRHILQPPHVGRDAARHLLGQGARRRGAAALGRSLEQAHAHPFLGLPQQPRQRRLGGFQGDRGLVQRAGLGGCEHGAQVA